MSSSPTGSSTPNEINESRQFLGFEESQVMPITNENIEKSSVDGTELVNADGEAGDLGNKEARDRETDPNIQINAEDMLSQLMNATRYIKELRNQMEHQLIDRQKEREHFQDQIVKLTLAAQSSMPSSQGSSAQGPSTSAQLPSTSSQYVSYDLLCSY